MKVKKIDQIRQILLRYWDPLGVGDNPNLADEYDAYLSAIYKILNSHGTSDQLMVHLQNIEENSLGMAGPETARKLTAQKLIEIE